MAVAESAMQLIFVCSNFGVKEASRRGYFCQYEENNYDKPSPTLENFKIIKLYLSWKMNFLQTASESIQIQIGPKWSGILIW